MEKYKINFKQFILIFYLYSLLVNFSISEKINILDYSGEIEFSKLKQFQINFKDVKSKIPDFFFQHAFVSVLVNVTIPLECSKKSNCGQPLRIYGKLNDPPRPEDLYFDKKDDLGTFSAESIIYGFEYSPCKLKVNDTLYLKLSGVEGKANFTLSVNFNYLKNYKVLCPRGEIPPPAQHFSAVDTLKGIYQWGGKLNKSVFDDEIYYSPAKDENNIEWMKIKLDNKKQSPSQRYGHSMINYQDYLIVFGGKNTNETSLNDLWIYDINLNSWIEIDYQISKNIPRKKFLHTGTLIKKYGIILYYGGKDDLSDTNIYILDLKILLNLIKFKKGLLNDPEFDYLTKVNHLWRIVPIEDILPRYGLSITSINEKEVLFFGGMDSSGYSTFRAEILNLDNFSVKILENNQPISRGFHGIKKYGTILLLYGGKTGSGEVLNDMWKFIINTRKWIKVEEGEKEKEFYLYKSGFSFLSISNSDRPIIYNGENRNKENPNEIILVDFEICTSESKLISDYDCLPCEQGYYLNDQKKCTPCSPGNYLKIDEAYTNSKCNKCPAGSFNMFAGQSDMDSCTICPYGFYTFSDGQKTCSTCPNYKICLPGTSQPKQDNFLLEKVKSSYQEDTNYPDFTNTNSQLRQIYRESGIIIVSIIMGLMLITLLICYKLKKSKITKCLIYLDFIPLTAGTTKKCSGGLITLIYTILILSLASTFVIRFIYFNEIIEVIPIAYSNSEQDSLESSLRFNVQIIGNNFNCIDRDNVCSSDFSISKNNDLNYFKENIKALQCFVNKEGHCEVSFSCEDCKTINNNDVIQIHIKAPESYVQLYRWNFESIWSENFDSMKGQSKIEGIFKPENNIEYI
jgi:hypothetical protein